VGHLVLHVADYDVRQTDETDEHLEAFGGFSMGSELRAQQTVSRRVASGRRSNWQQAARRSTTHSDLPVALRSCVSASDHGATAGD